ncbi:MAG: hypothetical protein KBG30_13610 [Bacteroidales bacterium]|jgi:hypothetical protein|nr:hypothetical protein [Bacteroidales bacterium]HNV97656.1 hypothetical protein [bacterium]HOK39338.1 hypothetical protein [Bacteroidales bacterium]HRT00701.1 hypothetical protein [Bacteroidales bacterium]HUM33593.1 hypothetical protein [Bacteroidales bacterium]
MEITAKITGIKYKPFLTNKLEVFNFKNLDINDLPSSCIINYDGFNFGLSKWVSPKRTRSYPYERVYNTLSTAKRITIIPIIKDEGKEGDRDFIQWDTVSLMSLLDVFVVFSYYKTAEKHKSGKNKITNQQFDNEWTKRKISEIKNYHSSALHWNLKEIEYSFPYLIQKSKEAYNSISKKLKVEFHNEQGIDLFAKQFMQGVNEFMITSRQKAKEAQKREVKTIQPKESLSTLTKAKITIENYLGGKYYFTVDELVIQKSTLFLIEDKHSKISILPSIGDIKDGLLKMILFSNLKNVSVSGKEYKIIPTLKLTSSRIKDEITISNLNTNKFLSEKDKDILKKLFKEAHENNFEVLIKKGL